MLVLFFSSVICVIGLTKLSIVGFEAMFGSLFLNGDKLSGRFASENKKLVSQGSVGSRKCEGGGKSSSSLTKFGGGGKSSKSLLYDLRGGL